jgi:maltose-binding protein MalE
MEDNYALFLIFSIVIVVILILIIFLDGTYAKNAKTETEEKSDNTIEKSEQEIPIKIDSDMRKLYIDESNKK